MRCFSERYAAYAVVYIQNKVVWAAQAAQTTESESLVFPNHFGLGIKYKHDV